MLAYYNIQACLHPADPVLILRWPVQDMEMMTSFCTGKSDTRFYKKYTWAKPCYPFLKVNFTFPYREIKLKLAISAFKRILIVMHVNGAFNLVCVEVAL